jgi:hypothetical protein
MAGRLPFTPPDPEGLLLFAAAAAFDFPLVAVAGLLFVRRDSRSRMKFLTKCWIAAAALLLNGCLVRETVTSGGQVVEDGYVVKRPLKEAIEKSN